VNAAYGCADGGSGLATCAGTVANLAAIDTSTVGLKPFVVTATDDVGNTSSRTVSYTVAVATISISNIPSNAIVGSSFIPTYAYPGDGATSVTTSTPDQCNVSGGTVTFLKKGTCTLTAHAGGTANFDAVNGSAQSFSIARPTPTITITNIPGTAVSGGSFTPVIAYTGTGTTHVKSNTLATCKVTGGVVKFVSVGTCTLVPDATPNGDFDAATGAPQSFLITAP
jgi:hypothetical protein